MNKTKTIQKNQKPIDLDVHLKYRCPNSNCSADHWKTLGEVSVKNFKIVCYCGLIIKPKQVDRVEIKYKKKHKQTNEVSKSNKIDHDHTIPLEILDKCSAILVGYGFTKNESEELLTSSWLKEPTDNCALLIKKTLENIGINYGKSDSSI